ncbi:MAG: hypothetical protein AB7V32_03160 [Candidatus Berkiella sp.]
MKIATTIGLIFGLILLSGCQQVVPRSEYLRNRSKDYLNSRLIPPIKVPQGLSEPPESLAYPLPSIVPPIGSLKPINLEPPGFGTLG